MFPYLPCIEIPHPQPRHSLSEFAFVYSAMLFGSSLIKISTSLYERDGIFPFRHTGQYPLSISYPHFLKSAHQKNTLLSNKC